MARPPERLFRLVFEPHDGRALSADSEEKREPARDIETATVESLKVLDTQWPIREAGMVVGKSSWRSQPDLSVGLSATPLRPVKDLSPIKVK